MTSDETIRKAARVIGSVMSHWDMDGRPDVDGGIDTLIARALDSDGLLAPAPLREEWGLLHPSGSTDMRRDRAHAESGVGNGWAVAHRYVSDWLPVDRAEGDGRAGQ